jgi:hypothetical protein
MKKLLLAILFYNSILVVVLITTGVVHGDFSSLGPSLLLVPVAFHYIVSLAHELTGFLNFAKSRSVFQIRRIISIYSFLLVLFLFLASLAGSTNIYQATLSILLLPLLLSFFLVFFDKQALFQFRVSKVINLGKQVKKYFESRGSSANSRSSKKTKADAIILNKKQTNKSKKHQKLKQKRPSLQEYFEAMNQVEKPTEKSSGKTKDKEIQESETEVLQEITTEYVPGVMDSRRRQFLKILGGGGATLLLMLFIMPKQASATFFGSAPGPGVVGIKDSSGNKIDPAEKQPTDGYTISEIDDDASPSYYGFIHQNGAWYITKEDETGAYRYAAGTSGFATNWDNRNSLTYGYFDTVF